MINKAMKDNDDKLGCPKCKVEYTPNDLTTADKKLGNDYLGAKTMIRYSRGELN
jgi:hypothetical protein